MSSLLLLLLSSFLILDHTSSLKFYYHNNTEMEQYLLQINNDNPDITHLYSIGESVRGQKLWVLVLSVRPHNHTIGIPEFKYVANMHGNEVLGRVLMLQLIDDLVRGYRNNEEWSEKLLSSTRIHIMPTMNPDGFDDRDTNCQYSKGRSNANNKDLNRNFPDIFDVDQRQQQVDEEKREAEVRAVIDWLKTETFVLSANLHGGALVASYPYDNGNRGSGQVGGASLAPDDDVFVHLATVYSHNHASMHRDESCSGTNSFKGGITNGYQWYSLSGGMQDYNYVWAQCLELTLEVSCCKSPPVDELSDLWTANRKSLLAYIQQIHLGVKGLVLNAARVPVQGAVVEVEGRKNCYPFITNQYGEYYRLLLPGDYTFTVKFPGHEFLTETLSVPNGTVHYSALKHDFQLRSITKDNSPLVNHTQTDYALQLDDGGAITGPTWTGLGVGLCLAAALQSLID